MPDIVLIPAFRRPEFLAVCLEQIATNTGYEQNHYIFALDFGFDPANLPIIRQFERGEGLKVTVIDTDDRGLKHGKQSYNVLNGYYRAYSRHPDAEFVFMIEEDVMVANDFFQWHRAVHDMERDIFCAIATANNNADILYLDKPTLYYLIHGCYQSLGVSFRTERLWKFLRFVRKEYFNDPIGYCRSVFPESKVNPVNAEQDGLIRRVQEMWPQYPIAFPYKPRAFHAGFYGMHRGEQMRGPLDLRISSIRQAIRSPEAMRQVAGRVDRDSVPVSLYNVPTSKLMRWQTAEIIHEGVRW